MSGAGDNYDPKKKSKFTPIDPSTLTPEEVQAFKQCVHKVYYTTGLPFALLGQVVTYLSEKQKAGGQPVPLSAFLTPKNVFIFFGSMMFGTYIFAPKCYRSLVQSRQAVIEAEKSEEDALPAFDKAQPIGLSRPEVYSDSSELSSVLHEADSTFTTDYSTSSILGNEILSEDGPVKNTPTTTYQDLRRQHRNTFNPDLVRGPPQQPLNVPAENPVAGPPSRSERESKKFVKRNKYGDEIE